GLLGARPHPGRVGPAAEEQQQAGDDHRLAGSGLAGHDRQARTQRQDRLLDDAEPADPQLVEHQMTSESSTGGGDASRRLRTGSWNFDTRRSAKFTSSSRTTLTGSSPRRIRTRAPPGT